MSTTIIVPLIALQLFRSRVKRNNPSVGKAMESLEVPWHQYAFLGITQSNWQFRLAAQTIASSNFLLAISGEEMSVDSGLPSKSRTQTLNVRHSLQCVLVFHLQLTALEMLASNPLYQDIGLDAAVLTSTKCLTSERDCDLLGLFYGFWGNWYNTVKGMLFTSFFNAFMPFSRTQRISLLVLIFVGSFPHGGYKELEAWKRMFFNASPANPVSWSEQEVFNCRPLTPWFFFFTTNIDSHPQNYFHDNEGTVFPFASSNLQFSNLQGA